MGIENSNSQLISCDDEASCSDYKIKIIETSWKELLLKWINECIRPTIKARELDARTLVEVINKYKHDICDNDVDRAILCTDDVEPFMNYKYPILRLRNLSEPSSLPKKLYIMTSVLLYHCCVNSIRGAVDRDICGQLSKGEQELILKFCECLNEVEITIYNVEYSIKEAYEAVTKLRITKSCKTVTKRQQRSLSGSPSDFESQSSYNFKRPTALDSVVIKKPAISFISSATLSQSSICRNNDQNGDFGDYVTRIREATNDFRDDVTSRDNIGVRVTIPKKSTMTCDLHSYRATNEVNNPVSEIMCCDSEDVCCSVPSKRITSIEADETYMNNQKTLSVLTCGNTRFPGRNFCEKKTPIFNLNVGYLLLLLAIFAVAMLMLVAAVFTRPKPEKEDQKMDYNLKALSDSKLRSKKIAEEDPMTWQFINGFCHKVQKTNKSTKVYYSPAQCILIEIGPQIWPHPIGETMFGKDIASFSVKHIKYTFETVPSKKVKSYLTQAFKLFVDDLRKLEKSDIKVNAKDLSDTKNLTVFINVENDPEPRLRLNTDESYTVEITTVLRQIQATVSSASFCGVRHGLETLSQMFAFDQSTGLLITLTAAVVKDAPSYRYRGLMIDTGRNYIPVPDLVRTLDAMAACKLNTFHWRISDATSFPLMVPNLEQLYQFGAYDADKVYTESMVKYLVKRAGLRGIRVVIEVAAPGPVGRAWSWSKDVYCTNKTDATCTDLCLRLNVNDQNFDILQKIYHYIINITEVDDVFHLSDSLFSLTYCSRLIEDRIGFLDKAINRLKISNNGFLPKLTLIWYTDHLKWGSEARAWDMQGVQLAEWVLPRGEKLMSRFKVVHSSRWDLSCDLEKNRCIKYRTWQQMYSWKQWETIEAFVTEGGEAVLWTDVVDAGNLDEHLWPRAAAVAERLWSNIILNTTATAQVYARLDSHMWRMIQRDVNCQPVWPLWCSFNPGRCVHKINE